MSNLPDLTPKNDAEILAAAFAICKRLNLNFTASLLKDALKALREEQS